MPRTFTAASSENISLAAGTTTTLGNAGVTVFAYVRAASDGAQRRVVTFGSGGGTSYTFGLDASNRVLFGNGTTNRTSTTTVLASDGVVLIGTTKATGSSTPRFHIYKGGAWTHENASGTLGNPSITGNAKIGSTAGGASFWDGDIAVLAAWGSTHTDAQTESFAYDLNAWWQVNPTVLWILDQSSVGMLVNDLTGNGADQTAITGTTAGTSSLPNFSYGAPIAVDTYAAAPISVALSSATITVTGVALAVTTGGVSVASSPATITDTPVALTISAAVSLALSPATITVTPVALVLPAPTGDQTAALTPATITVTPVALTTAAAVSLALTPAEITISPVGLTVTGGATSIALSPVEITVTPVALTVSLAGQFALSPAVVTVTPVAVTLVAAVDLALGTATITITPVGLSPTVGAVTVQLSPALIAVLAVALDIAATAGCLHLTLSDLGTVTVIVTDPHTVGLTLDDIGAAAILIGECP